MLFPRLLTAVIVLPFILAAIYFGSLPFFFLILGIILLGLREFYHLAEETGYPTASTFGLFAGAALVFSIFLNGTAFGSVTENQMTAAVFALILVGLVIRNLFRGPSETLLSEWGVTFFGLIFVAWSLSHLLLIRDLRPQGQGITY